MLKSVMLLGLWLLSGVVQAAPVIKLGDADDYCVVFCYIRIPFTITHYDSTRNIGMLYCDVDAEATASSIALHMLAMTREILTVVYPASEQDI